VRPFIETRDLPRMAQCCILRGSWNSPFLKENSLVYNEKGRTGTESQNNGRIVGHGRPFLGIKN
jgi:hypothetical protein